jgi:uncharacterized RDD family membrane protein YckC
VTQPPPNYPPPAGGYSVPPQSYPRPAYRPVPTAANGAPLADFGQRLLAYLLDGLIIAGIMLIPMIVGFVFLFMALFDRIKESPTGAAPDIGPIIVIYLVFLGVFIPLQLLVQYLYQVTYQVRKGQTVGKRVMKIKIVNAVDGSPMDTSAANKRFLVQVGCGLLGPLAYLDGLWQLWDQPYRQCLHDKWPQTVVVKVSA